VLVCPDIVVGVDMSDTGMTGMDVLDAGIPAIVALGTRTRPLAEPRAEGAAPARTSERPDLHRPGLAISCLRVTSVIV
jgi:hypothetical protein